MDLFTFPFPFKVLLICGLLIFILSMIPPDKPPDKLPDKRKKPKARQ